MKRIALAASLLLVVAAIAGVARPVGTSLGVSRRG